MERSLLLWLFWIWPVQTWHQDVKHLKHLQNELRVWQRPYSEFTHMHSFPFTRPLLQWNWAAFLPQRYSENLSSAGVCWKESVKLHRWWKHQCKYSNEEIKHLHIETAFPVVLTLSVPAPSSLLLLHLLVFDGIHGNSEILRQLWANQSCRLCFRLSLSPQQSLLVCWHVNCLELFVVSKPYCLLVFLHAGWYNGWLLQTQCSWSSWHSSALTQIIEMFQTDTHWNNGNRDVRSLVIFGIIYFTYKYCVCIRAANLLDLKTIKKKTKLSLL